MSGEFLTIANAPPDFTQQDELEAIDKVKAKEKKMEKEKDDDDNDDGIPTKEKYRYAFWFCHPRCGFKVDRRDVGAIQAHAEKCGWCIERREERAKATQSYQDGLAYMRGALTKLEKGIEDVLTARRAIKEIEQVSKLDNLKHLYEQDRRFHSNPDEIPYLERDRQWNERG